MADQKGKISINSPLTLFIINGMAICFRYEVFVRNIEGNKLTVSEKKKGKPKLFSFDFINHNILILEGHDLNLKADSETGSFWGNACFNLVGETREQIAEVLERTTLKEITDWQRNRLCYKTFTSGDDDSVVLHLYKQTQPV